MSVKSTLLARFTPVDITQLHHLQHVRQLLHEFAVESGSESDFILTAERLIEMLTDTSCQLKAVLIQEPDLTDADASSLGLMMFTERWATFTGQRVLYLNDIYIQPAYRSQGLGEQCIHFLTEYARERGCPRLELDCDEANTGGKKFYARHDAQPDEQWRTWKLPIQETLEKNSAQ